MRAILVLVLLLAGCESTGSPGTGDADAGPGAAARDGGSVRLSDGGSTTADGGSTTGSQDGGGATSGDAGSSTAPGDPDAGSSGADAGVYGGCGAVDLAGHWAGTFTGEVWWTNQPNNYEPVSGTVEFTLTCFGQKYGVTGTMTGSEAHLTVFSAQLSGEVTPGNPAMMNARMAGAVTFIALGNAQVPFTGTMTGAVVGTRVQNGSWQGQSTQPLVPAEGAGEWVATRQ
jgi:hypothetical protein